MIAERVDDVLREAVDQGQVAGVVALAGDAAGMRYAGAFGARALGQPTPMTLDTVFAIASMTKPITSVAALQLVEEGQVGLDEPIGRRMPELTDFSLLEGFDADGRPRLRASTRPITLRHLLTHTSGFSYPTWNDDVRRFSEVAGIPTSNAGRRGLEVPLVFEPGDRWEYGTSVDWVGELVARLTGATLSEYAQARILGPLGMHETGYGIPPARRERLAGRHARRADGTLEPQPFDPPAPPLPGAGGGGLFSTGPDYLRFVRAMLRGGELDGARILREETVRELGRNQIGPLRVLTMRSAIPGMSNDVEPFSGLETKWGLAGLLTTVDVPGGRAAGSWGWAGLYNTYFWVDPAQGIGALLLTQVLPFADTAVLSLLERFERAIYSSL